MKNLQERRTKSLLERANGLIANHQRLSIQCVEEKSHLLAAQQKVANTQSAQVIVQQVAQIVQQQVHSRIADVVTRCLKAVFGEEAYEFRINFQRKRGKTEAELVFVRDEKELDPSSSSGGGILDVTSFALRVSCLLLSGNKVRRLLVLDEPFRFLSVDYRPKVAELLVKLSQELRIQMIIVTHDEEFQVGKVIEI